MRLRVKTMDLMECINLSKYDALAEKYGLNREALKEVQTALRKGKWKPIA